VIVIVIVIAIVIEIEIVIVIVIVIVIAIAIAIAIAKVIMIRIIIILMLIGLWRRGKMTEEGRGGDRVGGDETHPGSGHEAHDNTQIGDIGNAAGDGKHGGQVAVDGRRQHGDSGNEADDTDSDSGEEDGNGCNGEEAGSGSFRSSSELSASSGSARQEQRKADEYCGRALYAEERKHVSIIFSDVVRFSRIVDGAPASKVRADTI